MLKASNFSPNSPHCPIARFIVKCPRKGVHSNKQGFQPRALYAGVCSREPSTCPTCMYAKAASSDGTALCTCSENHCLPDDSTLSGILDLYSKPEILDQIRRRGGGRRKGGLAGFNTEEEEILKKGLPRPIIPTRELHTLGSDGLGGSRLLPCSRHSSLPAAPLTISLRSSAKAASRLGGFGGRGDPRPPPPRLSSSWIRDFCA